MIYILYLFLFDQQIKRNDTDCSQEGIYLKEAKKNHILLNARANIFFCFHILQL